MNCSLCATLETKAKYGHRGFAAAHVQGLLQATEKESEGFDYSRQTFTKIGETKIEERIFVCSQRKQIFAEQNLV